MNLFRIHIRPQGGSADMHKTFDYCLRNGVLGVGWRVESLPNTFDWNEYYSKASLIHENLQVCSYIQREVKKDDLIWTRDFSGQYYLARAESGWQYWKTAEADEFDIDIANIFRCSFQKVDIDAVPGKVVACFRATRSIQRIADDRAIEYSKYLWNKLRNKTDYELSKSFLSHDIFMMLDDEETEDLVFLFLQSQGWYVIPNSRKADTMSFEYYLVKPQTKEFAVAQVKTGETAINRDEYKELGKKIFLFQSNEHYIGNESSHIFCLSRKDLMDFLFKELDWLPKIFKIKTELASGGKSPSLG